MFIRLAGQFRFLVIPILAIYLLGAPFAPITTVNADPLKEQVYFLSIPEDDALQLAA